MWNHVDLCGKQLSLRFSGFSSLSSPFFNPCWTLFGSILDTHWWYTSTFLSLSAKAACWPHKPSFRCLHRAVSPIFHWGNSCSRFFLMGNSVGRIPILKAWYQGRPPKNMLNVPTVKDWFFLGWDFRVPWTGLVQHLDLLLRLHGIVRFRT